MKAHTLVVTLGAALLLGLGCSGGTTDAASSTPTTTSADGGLSGVPELATRLQALKRKVDGRLSGLDFAVADLRMIAAAKGVEEQNTIHETIEQIVSRKDAIKAELVGTRAENMTLASMSALEHKVEPMLAELEKLIDESRKR